MLCHNEETQVWNQENALRCEMHGDLRYRWLLRSFASPMLWSKADSTIPRRTPPELLRGSTQTYLAYVILTGILRGLVL